MNRETFALSQKELQRVAVISACIKGEVACARAAELLCLSVRQIKRLKKRLREDGEAALAHASRGRPSPRRLPVRMRDRILHLARTRYVGFNDHGNLARGVVKEAEESELWAAIFEPAMKAAIEEEHFALPSAAKTSLAVRRSSPLLGGAETVLAEQTAESLPTE